MSEQNSVQNILNQLKLEILKILKKNLIEDDNSKSNKLLTSPQKEGSLAY